MWDLSCKDWEQRIMGQRSLIPDLPFNEKLRSAALEVMDKLIIPDLIGKPRMAEQGAPWAKELVAAVAGSWFPDKNVREIMEFFCMVPKKNVKTGSAAAIMVDVMLLNQRPSAEFFLLGPAKDVAGRAYKQAADTIRGDPENFLPNRFLCKDHVKEIVDRKNQSVLKVISFDTKIATGIKPVGVLLDEIHEIAKMPGAQDVLVQILGGMLGNPEAFIIYITTQSAEPPTGIFKNKLELARDVRDGKVTDVPLLPMLYEFPAAIMKSKDQKWKDKNLWHLVNPNVGKSVSIAKLETLYATAVREGEASVIKFASQHLNVEVGVGIQAGAWQGALFWEKAGNSLLTIEELFRRSEVVVIGADGGGLDDLFGLAVMGRDKETKDWLLWTHAWCHRSVLKTRLDIESKLLELEKIGELTICDEVGRDLVEIVDYIIWADALGLLPEEGAVGVDPVGISELLDVLAENEFDISVEAKRIVSISQGYQLTNMIMTVARRVAGGTFQHGAQPLMNWCVGNAKQEPRGNALIITKQASGKAKIDPLMATFNCASLMSRNPQSQRSVYETRGAHVV